MCCTLAQHCATLLVHLELVQPVLSQCIAAGALMHLDLAGPDQVEAPQVERGPHQASFYPEVPVWIQNKKSIMQ